MKLPQNIKRRVLSELTLITAATIGLTSRANLSTCKAHARDRVGACLTQFDLPMDDTLDVMRSTGTIISGSAVLALIDRVDYQPGDLDIYATNNGIDIVRRFLVSRRFMPVEARALRGDLSDGTSAQPTRSAPDVRSSVSKGGRSSPLLHAAS